MADDKTEDEMPTWFLLIEITSAIFVLPAIIAISVAVIVLLRESPDVRCQSDIHVDLLVVGTDPRAYGPTDLMSPI